MRNICRYNLTNGNQMRYNKEVIAKIGQIVRKHNQEANNGQKEIGGTYDFTYHRNRRIVRNHGIPFFRSPRDGKEMDAGGNAVRPRLGAWWR